MELPERCDTCGEPATNFARDAREVEPLAGSDGSLYEQWEVAEHIKAGCVEHPAQSVETRRVES